MARQPSPLCFCCNLRGAVSAAATLRFAAVYCQLYSDFAWAEDGGLNELRFKTKEPIFLERSVPLFFYSPTGNVPRFAALRC